MQSRENLSSNNEPKPASDGKNPWQKMADEVLADNYEQQESIDNPNGGHEVSSETTKEESIIVADKTEDKDIKFPDIEVNWDSPRDFLDKYEMVLKWLWDVANEDGSWKYDGITIPEEWRRYVDQELETRKELYEGREESRKMTIDWIKNSKNIDFSLGDDQEIEECYSKLSDDDKKAVWGDKDKMINSLDPFVEKTNSKERIDGLLALAKIPFKTFISKYGDGIITDSTADIIIKRIQKIASEASNRHPDDGTIRADDDEYTKEDREFSHAIYGGANELSAAIKVAYNTKDDQAINAYMDIVAKHPLLERYARIHPIDRRRMEAYVVNVVPMVDKKDPEVQRLWDGPDGMMNGFTSVFDGSRFGTSDFCIHALTSEINPANIQELLLARRDVSADNYATYEQNREDAYELEGTIIGYRGFIHRESPGEHEILSAMLKFYDTKDDSEEHTKAEAKLREIYKIYGPGGYNYALDDRMFDLNNYELDDQQREGNGFETGRKEKVVDALRRLVENTDPKLLEKPAVKDGQLNDLIQNMYLGINKQSGEVYVDFKEVGKVVKRMNELLKERQGKTGIKPSEIKAIAFVERAATFAMRGISKKDRSELPFDSGFKEMCRFAELTSQSNKYEEADFESFWNRFSRIKDFEDETELMSHYQMLSSRRLAQLRGLPEKTPFLKKKADALWSGNLNDELLRLVDER